MDIVRSCCPHDCPDGCGFLVTRENGRAVRVAGDPEHPFTRGTLCPKTAHYERTVYSPLRLTTPLRRTGKKGQGEFEPVTGNQTGVLLLDYLIGAMKRAGKLPAHPAALKTIVTTEMARAVAEANGLDCYDTFTGFKFMAEKMNELESAGKNTVIFSYEESYGYMIGHYVRDKDAVTASLLLTEMAAWYHAQGMTLFDALRSLYEKYGWYGEKTHNLVMPGLDGLEKMAALMQSLRAQPPVEIGGVTVAQYKDYSDGTVRDAATGAVTPMPLSGSNVLRFELTDGTHIVVRPSGTEPKIKVYILTKGADAAERDANLEKYSAWVKTLA